VLLGCGFQPQKKFNEIYDTLGNYKWHSKDNLEFDNQTRNLNNTK